MDMNNYDNDYDNDYDVFDDIDPTNLSEETIRMITQRAKQNLIDASREIFASQDEVKQVAMALIDDEMRFTMARNVLTSCTAELLDVKNVSVDSPEGMVDMVMRLREIIVGLICMATEILDRIERATLPTSQSTPQPTPQSE
jgi:hypothetical protein